MKPLAFKRILYINTAFLGDAILSTPMLKALRILYPKARLDLVAIPQTAEVFRDNPNLDNIFLWDKRSGLKRNGSFLRLALKLRKNRYDLAISPHVHFSTTLLMLLSGIPVRIGFPRLKGTTIHVRVEKGVPVVKRNLELLKPLTNKSFSHQTELFPSPQDKAEVEGFLKEKNLDEKRMVTLAPGSVWATKRWLPERFAEVVKTLSGEGWRCVLVGGKDDAELCGDIIRRSETDAITAAGRFGIRASACLIGRSRLLITNDSAPLHLANAMGTRVLAIFGPTVLRFGFFPFGKNDRVLEIGLECRPCGKHGHQNCPQGHFSCMKGISSDLVIRNAREMLG
jgi:heptosyltransferase-2